MPLAPLLSGKHQLPLTAPMVQPIRLAMGAASWAEVTLEIGLALATIALLVALSARTSRGGVMRTRGKVSINEAWGTSAPRQTS